MEGMRVVLTAFTVAHWGGLHENVIASCRALHRAGVRVMFIGTEGAVCDAAREIGLESVIGVDWNGSLSSARRQAIEWQPDLVFSQPFDSRELGQEIRRETGAKFVVMFHGIAHDDIHLWHDELDRLLVTSPSIGAAVEGYCFVPQDKITVLPNGVDDAVVERPLLSLAEKLEIPVVALAGRLSHDKVRMIDGGVAVARALEAVHGRPIAVRVLGDGPDRGEFQARLEAKLGRGRVEMLGWVAPPDVAEILSSSLVCVSAGRGALKATAVGTPVFGAGARADIGLQLIDTLESALECNFGDYVPPTDIWTPVSGATAAIRTADSYRALQDYGREVVRKKYVQSEIDRRLIDVLTSIV
ncbi:glycosyltransferase [Promicromonospora panici]|uniref:glycosyltransferase n=1 Tax=Promicromonospora panici TaxID=2219658 RepID=UPI0013ECC98F|nr:glycosyltransferase [Promicromonospora panici]